ncbi:MAG: SRPBCC family protein [Luteolibacter sp.]
MATLKTIKASKHDCMDAWLQEDKVREWLADSGTVQGEDLILTSRIPNVSGRHRLVTQTETELIYDWYVDGCKTLLKVSFEDVGNETSVSVEHRFPDPLPVGILFPPGEYYGDQAWSFAINQLESYIETGKPAMILPWPDDQHTIRHEITIAVAPEKVWQMLTTAGLLKQLRLVSEGAAIEPRIGGRYSFGWEEPEQTETDGPGHITQWVDGARLAHTWYGGRDSIISWSLEKLNESETKVVFAHTGLIFSYSDTWSYKLGWADHLMEMKSCLEQNT